MRETDRAHYERVLAFVNQSNAAVNLGFPADPGIATRGLGAKTSPNRDNWAFDKVGKQGIGSIELSADGLRLYVMDLTNRQVLCIDFATKKLIWKLAVSTPACVGGTADIRPWALKEHNGILYVGAVCSGETNQNNDQLHYYVMQCNSLTAATSMSLAADLGGSKDKEDSDWLAWLPNTPNSAITGIANGSYVIYSQPTISNIEFDNNDNMIVGMMDRGGHMFGNSNYVPGVSNTNLFKNIAGGDMARVVRSGASTYTVETAPFTFFDTRAGIQLAYSPPYDQFNGGLVVNSANGQNIAVTNLTDPLSVESTGTGWLAKNNRW